MLNNRLASLILLPGLILLPVHAFAQQQTTPTDKQATTQPQTTPAQQDPAPQKQAPAQSSSTDEPFVPSETISEDLSVPFPVDI